MQHAGSQDPPLTVVVLLKEVLAPLRGRILLDSLLLMLRRPPMQRTDTHAPGSTVHLLASTHAATARVP